MSDKKIIGFIPVYKGKNECEELQRRIRTSYEESPEYIERENNKKLSSQRGMVRVFIGMNIIAMGFYLYGWDIAILGSLYLLWTRYDFNYMFIKFFVIQFGIGSKTWTNLRKRNEFMTFNDFKNGVGK